MLRSSNIVSVLCLIGLTIPSYGFKAPDGMKPPEGVENMKKSADESQMSEEQFYRCFADINCKLGEGARKDAFDCYQKNSEEEVAIYARWFKDSPKGNFEEEDLTLTGVNTKFCTLSYEDQRVVNDHFAAQCKDNLKNICPKPDQADRCKRLRNSSLCIQRLIRNYVASGKCDTIVNEAPIPREK